MKNFLLTLGLVLAVCAVAFGAVYAMNCEPAVHEAASSGDAMQWLRTEFKLDERQFAAVEKLHEDYGVVCAGHCSAIMDARKRRVPPAEMAALEATCLRAMTEHFQHVATLMPAGQGERYLATVLPRVAGHDHEGAPTVQVSR